MLFRILPIIQCMFLVFKTASCEKSRCLTGYMTDRQLWVDERGLLMNFTQNYSREDLSKQINPINTLRVRLENMREKIPTTIKFMSMAYCELSMIPMFPIIKDSEGRNVSVQVEHLTMYGNKFGSYANNLNIKIANFTLENPLWSEGLRNQNFSELLELDLRACSIDVLDNHAFMKMAKLKSLYLGENRIHLVKQFAFEGLNKLTHLDMSRNLVSEAGLMTFEDHNAYANIKNLKSLDFSYTKITQANVALFRHLSRNMTSLSLCETGITKLDPHQFYDTSMSILDISSNYGILNEPESLFGLENTLEILYAENINLKSFELFKGLKKLEVLKVANNDLSFIRPETVKSLQRLTILDLDMNRISRWLTPTFADLSNLKYLSLRKNNINYLSHEIIQDIAGVKYVGLSGNNVVCNCFAKDLFVAAYINDVTLGNNQILLGNNKQRILDSNATYHTGFTDYNKKVHARIHMYNEEEDEINLNKFLESIENVTIIIGDFILYDYDLEAYQCFLAAEGTQIPLVESQCERTKSNYDIQLQNSMIKLIISPLVLAPLLVLTYIFRRKLRYCFVTMRNSTMLGMLQNNDIVDDDTIFNYDVFVSYCNDDRAWILDSFLPQVERDTGVCVCLHERDFQVGLSILQNIVNCMDRSRSIMLILSKKFLQSQWCQFEMHLAQHRLLETRREDLILILLEDIPRKMRPNTLHYLMMTKTYIVWSQEPHQQALFWKRLKRSLVTQKTKYAKNTSLA